MQSNSNPWAAAASYETYMGRWSRRLAPKFLAWVDAAPNRDWVEIGCGTGALTSFILADADPASIVAVDSSEGFIEHARGAITDPRVRFEIADAQELPLPAGSADIAASGLALNFVPDRHRALAEIRRVLRPAGRLGFYVWDYPGGGIGFIAAFWKAAAALGLGRVGPNEGQRFPFCTPDGLTALCREAVLQEIEVTAIELQAEFSDFDAFWQPFMLGAGPAPAFCIGLPEVDRMRLRAQLLHDLGSGPISLPARAWAVKARRDA